jgi:hypothetical protein
MMSRALLALALMSSLNGCLLFAAALGCDDQPVRGRADPECEAIEGAAAEADRAVIEAVRNPRVSDVPLVPLRLEGRITHDGVAVARAAVRLTLADATLALVRTDADGHYDLSVLAEEPTCPELRLSVSVDDGRSSEPTEPGCVAAALDYDFGSSSWTVRRSSSRASRPDYRSSLPSTGRSTPISNEMSSTRSTSLSR